MTDSNIVSVGTAAYKGLVTWLLEALREQDAEVEQLKSELTAVRAERDYLLRQQQREDAANFFSQETLS